MSFLKKFMKSNNNCNNIDEDINKDNKRQTNDSFRRKFDRKLILSQSDPEPILDLSDCRLDSICGQIQTTIKIYAKTDVRFDNNLLTSFGVDSLHPFSGVKAIHLSDNRIHTIGPFVSQLTQLKELYLSHNQLSSLPDSLSILPSLKILSIRDNRFTEVPECLSECQPLSCIDLGDNHIVRLPPTLSRLRHLKSLQVDGNPLTEPSAQVCAQGFDAIMAELRRNCEQNSNEFDDNIANNDTIEWRTAGPDQYGTGSDDDKHISIEEGIEYQNFQNLKDQKKRQLIEWERNFQSFNSSEDLSKDSIKKKETLYRLWSEQRQMSADINSHLHRKDQNRKNMLENISKLEKHCKQLLYNLYNWEERHKSQLELLEREENQLLELMLNYDKREDLKKSAIIIAMQEMLNRDSMALALSDELKETNGLELRSKIFEKEQLQRQAFEAFQRARDYKSRALSNQILLIENELTNLTQVELNKKDDRLDSILNDIRTQRSQLARMLAKLLEQKRERDSELRKQLLQMESRRMQVNDSDYWFVQYQCLLERQPIEAQICQYNIEDRIASVLMSVHKQYDRIVNYLSLFTDLTFDRLNAMSDKALLSLGIDDYELCKLIRDQLDIQCQPNVGASAHVDEEPLTPSAPLAGASSSAPLVGAASSAPTAFTATLEFGGQLANVRLWCQTECVICFETNCDMVFLPCGHVCTCKTCSHLIHLCPLCRVEIAVKQCLNT